MSGNVLSFTQWQPPVFDRSTPAAPATAAAERTPPTSARPAPDPTPVAAPVQAVSEPDPILDVPAIKFPTAAEIDQIRQDAQREGYAAGYEEGTARVRMEAMRLHSAVEQIDAAMVELENSVARDILDLSVELARQILRQALEIRPEVIVGVVKDALNQLPHQHTSIYLHPDDASLVRSYIGDQLGHAGHRVFEDPRVDRGGCKIEASGSQIDAGVATRWQRVIEALVDDRPWVEPRE